MASVVRQSNLFAGEDFTKVYKSFQDIDFTVYDFDGIRNALIEYIQIHYPEDFNDYTESSEFIAIVELLAYLGTTLAFRSDLNARENILDTAERRESIIRLAKMINYQPKRNIAASGLLKVQSVITDQPVKDNNGNNLSGTQIQWNDPNNPDWLDQFTAVLNAAFNPTNSFGRPSTSGTVGGIKTDLYQLNNILGTNVAYRVSTYVNGEQISFDLVNPEITEVLKERHPDPNEPFNFVYRNDRLGYGSKNTGFFVMFKQGRMDKRDFSYNFAEPNRLETINVPNINNEDVYVQEIDVDGNVINKWTKVPSVNGNNVVYNSISFRERNIFEVNSGLNDTITIKYPDGNFGNVPTGIFRVWYRTSLNRSLTLQPDEVDPISVSFSYTGKNGQEYRLTVNLELVTAVNNSAPSETNEQIKLRAPQVYHTQNRMVNSEDYNVFPLLFGNEIVKMKSLNRTYSGHSRYIDLGDVTGFHKDLTIIDDDGYIYNENTDKIAYIDTNEAASGSLTVQGTNTFQELVSSNETRNFFYLTYLPMVKAANPGVFDITGIYWKNMPDNVRDDTGFFTNSIDASDPNWPYNAVVDTTTAPLSFVKSGSILITEKNGNEKSLSVTSVSNNGIPGDPISTVNGPIRLGDEIYDTSIIKEVIPSFRTILTEDEIDLLSDKLINNNSFSVRYDVINDEWIFGNYSNTDDYDYNDPTNNWMVNVKYINANNTESAKFEFVSRGIKTVFGSYESVQFYWDKNNKVTDARTGKSLTDQITVLSSATSGTNGECLRNDLKFDIVDEYYLSDGTRDTTKVIVLPSDINYDGTLDNPYIFSEIVGTDDEIILTKEYDNYGYPTIQPWVSRWADLRDADVGQLTPVRLYPSIYVDINEMAFIFGGFDGTTTVPDEIYRFSDYDLFIFKSFDVLSEIERQLDTYYTFPNLRPDVLAVIEYFDTSKCLTVGVPGERTTNKVFYKFEVRNNRIRLIVHDYFWSRNGRSFTQDMNSDREDFVFKWNHYVPSTQVVDPSPTNIVDILMITNDYYRLFLEWKKNRGTISEMPKAPTTSELRNRFNLLESYKSISDHLSYNSGKFKILFGPQAPTELQASFKAIKIPNSGISDNELKSKIVEAIDEFFDIDNWDFGEKFYFTELAAFIHHRLIKYLSSIVIVPKYQESEFGDLFEIKCLPDEIFISTATVADVEVINSFTNTNLRM